jgi:hypothetical protein
MKNKKTSIVTMNFTCIQKVGSHPVVLFIFIFFGEEQVRISEMLLGKVPEGFTFAPKHKSNSYDRAENG